MGAVYRVQVNYPNDGESHEGQMEPAIESGMNLNPRP